MANASDLRERVRTLNASVFDEALRLLMAELAEAAPLGETGDTRRGLGAVPGGGGTTMSATVRSESPHGDYVEEGTRAHTVEPVNGKALRFLGGSGRISTAAPNQRVATRAGGVVFAKRANIPAQPPRPWFRPVVDRWADFLERAYRTLG